jgi:hypothetical protein
MLISKFHMTCAKTEVSIGREGESLLNVTFIIFFSNVLTVGLLLFVDPLCRFRFLVRLAHLIRQEIGKMKLHNSNPVCQSTHCPDGSATPIVSFTITQKARQ